MPRRQPEGWRLVCWRNTALAQRRERMKCSQRIRRGAGRPLPARGAHAASPVGQCWLSGTATGTSPPPECCLDAAVVPCVEKRDFWSVPGTARGERKAGPSFTVTEIVVHTMLCCTVNYLIHMH